MQVHILNDKLCRSELDQKPTGLDLHCLQRQGISGFSRTRVKFMKARSSPMAYYWEPVMYPGIAVMYHSIAAPIPSLSLSLYDDDVNRIASKVKQRLRQ